MTTKHDLKSLKDLPTPAAESIAKAAAIRAAMKAYSAPESMSPFDSAENNSENSPKEEDARPRPTHVTSLQPRRRLMRSMNSRYAIAASVAAMAVSLPVLLHFMNSPSVKHPPAKSPIVVAELKSKPADLDRGASDKIAAAKPKPVTTGKEADGRQKSDIATRTKDALQRLDEIKNERVAREEQRTAERQAKQLAAQQRALAQPRIALQPAPPPASESNALFGTLDASRSQSQFQGASKLGAHNSRQFPQSVERLAAGIMPHDAVPPPRIVENRDQFEHVASNPVKQVSEHPVSTFSVDVDTASYSVVRRWLNQGKLPPKDAVRIEELINYFSYDYAIPQNANEPFKTTVSVVPSPWSAERQLVHIGIKGYELKNAERPRANLVLLIDVSGSMSGQNRLPLLKNAFKMLIDNMRPDDTIGIVTYASGSGVALEPTKVAEKHKIIAAIDRLGAGGSTAGAQGIQDAYRLAEAGFDKTAVNRVILGTDGDFNVGITNRNDLKGFIERKRESGIFLSILGVGRGNYNDALMQTLAQNGNGTAAYIDTLNEARKVLVEEASSTLFPIAKDVKIQFEFNPAQVRDYRLIGYETRALRRQDFNNDKIDAGDVGSGHAVTAIYEITPVGAKTSVVDNLRYGQPAAAKSAPQPTAAPNDGKAGELGFLKLRYKLPAETASRLITMPVKMVERRADLSQGATDVRFAIAVAAFGQLLKGETMMSKYTYDDVVNLANGARGSDPFGLRAEFVNLVRLAKSARP